MLMAKRKRLRSSLRLASQQHGDVLASTTKAPTRYLRPDQVPLPPVQAPTNSLPANEATQQATVMAKRKRLRSSLKLASQQHGGVPSSTTKVPTRYLRPDQVPMPPVQAPTNSSPANEALQQASAMAQVKRLRSSLRLATQQQSDGPPPTAKAPSHSLRPDQAPLPSVPTPIAPDQVPLSPVQTPINCFPANEDPQHALDQPTDSKVARGRSVGRESTVGWNVEIIDSENVHKKIKIKVKEVSNLPRGERIIVEFDDQGSAYGEAQGLLAGYCGILAANCNLFPISFEKWLGKTGMPKTYKDKCFDTLIKPRFYFRTSESIAYRYCNQSIAKKWATSRQRIWNEFYDPAQSRDEIVENVPVGIQRDQWAAFVDYRLKPSTMKLCRKNKENRSKQIIPHTCGAKPNSRRRHELLLETGEAPSRARMYIETHKRKNGSFVNDEARAVVEQIKLNMKQSNIHESQVSPDDAVGKVLGPEHSGRVRCMGMGAAPTNTFRNVRRSRLTGIVVPSSDVAGSSSPTYTNLRHRMTQLEIKVQGLTNVIKAYIISKEGKIPEELAGYFSSEIEPDDVGSESTPRLDARRSATSSSEGSNSNNEAL
ncbi:hypothetical protein Ahy_A10g047189 [Arachis hypogaea]|uniref:Transposase, Ptta/En/Spm, plant n=1 Tax=Arachis hypogaea TaxID=3818 RepID=A0A445B1T0_ARAHY|nr:hypothetical protein Ahy_A10g047189 [Arachis hypogaea]